MGLVGFLLCPPPVNFPLESRPTKTKTPSGCSCQRSPQLCRWPQASQAEAHVSREGRQGQQFQARRRADTTETGAATTKQPLGKRRPLKSAKVPHNSPEHGRVIFSSLLWDRESSSHSASPSCPGQRHTAHTPIPVFSSSLDRPGVGFQGLFFFGKGQVIDETDPFWNSPELQVHHLLPDLGGLCHKANPLKKLESINLLYIFFCVVPPLSLHRF